MVDKRFSFMYMALFSFFISIMVILMILLFVEYRFFCHQAKELIELKQEYAYYIEVLNKKISQQSYSSSSVSSDGDPDWNDLSSEALAKEEEEIGANELSEELSEDAAIKEIMAAEASDAPDDDDDYVDDSFVIINRHPDHLKQSSIDYIESQDFNALMTSIDIDRWADYSVNTVVPIKKSVVQKKSTTASSHKQAPKIMAMHRPIKECGFMWPIDADKFWLSSLFGPRKRIDGTWGFHHGIDMAAVKGTPVKVVRMGTVTEASFQTGYGNTVVVQHNDILKTRYAHLHTIRVGVGQKIKQGSIIGTVGETGFIRKKGKDGSHLHFEVYERGKRINPMHCLPRTT